MELYREHTHTAQHYKINPDSIIIRLTIIQNDSILYLTLGLELKIFGERPFSFYGPKTWNSPSKYLRETAS